MFTLKDNCTILVVTNSKNKRGKIMQNTNTNTQIGSPLVEAKRFINNNGQIYFLVSVNDITKEIEVKYVKNAKVIDTEVIKTKGELKDLIEAINRQRSFTEETKQKLVAYLEEQVKLMDII